MKLYVVLSCWIDLTDPEPNVSILGVWDEDNKEKAYQYVREQESDGGESWCGVRTIELNDPKGHIFLTKDDVDMQRFC